MTLALFFIVYIIADILTFMPLWYRDTGFVNMGTESYTGLVVLYLIMIAVSIYLGIKKKANWLFVFPLVAGIIAIMWPDTIMWLATVINIVALVLGVVISMKK